MPLFGLFKKRSQSKPSHIFDETKLSTLIRDHDQKTAQSADTPISTNYHLTPINNGNIEHLDHFPYTPSVNNSNHSNSAISVCDNDTDIFTYQHNDSMDSICPTLLSHGYQQIKVIRNLSQGQLIEIRSLKNPFEPMVVKKVSKNLYWNKITKSDEDGVHDMVEKNIIKEALLLHHCTVANKPPAPAICQYIDFFYDTKYYYLVMEYAGNITLAEWCDKAFEYINKGKLDIEHYKQMVQYIFWQITALIYWLHHDMNICHLAITMEQIMVENCDFIECENGKMKINDGIVIKLCDFGLAEIFSSECSGIVGKMAMKTFECNKHCGSHHSQHSAPQLFELSLYNAQKADMWCCGMLLYRLTFNKYPFMFQNAKYDAGFRAIESQVLKVFFERNNLNKYTFEYLNILLSGLLNCNENERFDASQIIQSDYFKLYWKRYGERITKKSLAQRERLNNSFQQKLMRDFPYYSK